MLKEGLCTYLYRQRLLGLAVVIALSLLIGCASNDANTYFASVHQLRIDTKEFVDRRVIVRGYLTVRPPAQGQSLFVYATKDDAKMSNLQAGVPIGEEPQRWLSCAENFVKIIGKFSRIGSDEEFALTGLEHVVILHDSLLRELPLEEPCGTQK